MPQCVVLFYKYFDVPMGTISGLAAPMSSCDDKDSKIHGEDPLRDLLLFQDDVAVRLGLSGRVLVSEQGVNGTVSGGALAIDNYTKEMEHYTFGGHELFRGVHWKRSSCEFGREPFPDFRARRVHEIVSSGRTLDVDVHEGGTHLSPRSFHKVLMGASCDDDLVVLDVRNRWEHAIGHFVDGVGRKALHPNMRNFSQFRDFIDIEGPQLLAGKKVLMYCTGGIRCETASAYLKSTGMCAEVCQLYGGIHTYCEEFSDPPSLAATEGSPTAIVDVQVPLSESGQEAKIRSDISSTHVGEVVGEKGLFVGKNFVFDRRVALPGCSDDIVGRCSECNASFDSLDSAVCTVCVCPVLVCQSCRQGVPWTTESVLVDRGQEQSCGERPGSFDKTKTIGSAGRRSEWFCEEHADLRGMYFHFLDGFSAEALIAQQEGLQARLAQLPNKDFAVRPGEAAVDSRQRRYTVTKQLARIQKRLKELEHGAPLRDPQLPFQCRCCGKNGCNGQCWGFWKAPISAQTKPASF